LVAEYPGAAWSKVVDAAAAGLSPSRFAALRAMLAQGQTTGMMVVVGGRVLFEYGDVVETSYVASARKSLVSMLYGKYVTNAYRATQDVTQGRSSSHL
jgi:hypothetical protein